jgi:hypothetical protein
MLPVVDISRGDSAIHTREYRVRQRVFFGAITGGTKWRHHSTRATVNRFAGVRIRAG